MIVKIFSLSTVWFCCRRMYEEMNVQPSTSIGSLLDNGEAMMSQTCALTCRFVKSITQKGLHCHPFVPNTKIMLLPQ